jgi:acyl-CoA synthetase (NDP forming)
MATGDSAGGDVRGRIETALAAGRSVLGEIESKELIAALGVQVAMPRMCATADDAASAAAAIGFPVALKLASTDVSHKSDVGGVELGLQSADGVRAAFDRIRDNLAATRPDAHFDGVTVQPMVAGGVEMIVGITRDDRFGPIITAGFGGVLVELMRDVVTRLAPIDTAQARAMIDSLRGRALLSGYRGRPPADLDALAALIVKVGLLAAEVPELRELDLNPVTVDQHGVTVLDARAVVAPVSPKLPADQNREARLANLRRAFEPRTVVVIGDKRAGHYMWLRALKGFTGKLYSVQIDPAEITGIEALGVENRLSLAEIAEPIDYALSAVPRQVAPRILRDCIAAGVGALGFFTSGFSETGEDLGRRLEDDIRTTALASEIAIIGPNCMGLCNPGIGMLNFAGIAPNDGGDVGFISQSGTHAVNFCLQAAARGIKVSRAASIGNATVIEAADYLDLMSDDPATRAIAIYIEGVRDGRRFFESLKRAAERHPVFVLKGGTTAAGARATLSHTASLAAPAAVWDAMMRQSGAVAVPSIDGLLDALELAVRGRAPMGRAMGLVAMTGGQSVVITDTFAAAGLEVPTLSTESIEELKSFFNVIGGSYKNPLDAGGTIGFGADLGQLERILNILEADAAIDSIALEIATGLRGDVWRTHENELIGILDHLAAFNSRTLKPFATILHGAHLEELVARARDLARARGLVVFDSFERAARAFAAVAEYHDRRAALGSSNPTVSASASAG